MGLVEIFEHKKAEVTRAPGVNAWARKDSHQFFSLQTDQEIKTRALSDHFTKWGSIHLISVRDRRFSKSSRRNVTSTFSSSAEGLPARPSSATRRCVGCGSRLSKRKTSPRAPAVAAPK